MDQQKVQKSSKMKVVLPEISLFGETARRDYAKTAINTMACRKIEKSSHGFKCVAPPIPILPLIRKANVQAQNSRTDFDEKGKLYTSTIDLFRGDIVWQPVKPTSLSDSDSKDDVFNSKYDERKPLSSCVVTNILKMRNALNWRTMLPRHGPGVRREIRIANHRNPTNEILNPLKDRGDHIYAIVRNQQRWPPNPYELKAVSCKMAKSKSVYYIISASSITKFYQNRKKEVYLSEVESIIWWLYEARLFNMISHLKVFTNFRIWKHFSIWRAVVRLAKNQDNKNLLLKIMICQQEKFLKCVYYVRSVCESLSSSKNGLGVGENAVLLLKFDSKKVYKLDEFCDIQEKQLAISVTTLQRLRDQISKVAARVCEEFCEDNGITRAVLKGLVTVRKTFISDDKTGLLRTSYIQMSNWRKLLQRLNRFLRVLDLLMQESLTRIVLKSVQFLHGFIVDSNKVFILNNTPTLYEASPTVLYEKVTKFSKRVGYSSWEEMKVMHRKVLGKNQEAYMFGNRLKLIVNKKMKLNGKGEDNVRSNDEDGNKRSEEHDLFKRITKPMFIIQLKLQIEEESVKRVGSLINIPTNRFITNLSAPQLSTNQNSAPKFAEITEKVITEDADVKSTLEPSDIRVVVIPDKQIYVASIRSIISKYENVIPQLALVSKADVLADYVRNPPAFDVQLSQIRNNVEEENLLYHFATDDDLEDSYNSKNQTFTLDALHAQASYHQIVSGIIHTVDVAVTNVQKWSKDFYKFEDMVKDCRASCTNGCFPNSSDWGPAEFAKTLAHFTDMVNDINGMKKVKRVGLFEVESKQLSEMILPYPQKIIQALHRVLPQVAIRRNRALLYSIHLAIKKLSEPTETVEAFISHLTFLAHCASDISNLETEYNIIIQFFTIIKDYEVDINPEELAIFRTMMPTFQLLKNTLFVCEAKKSDGILRFSGELDDLVEELRGKLFEMHGKVLNPKLLDADTPTVQILDTISKLSDEVEVIARNARNYASYQERFGSTLPASTIKLYTVEAMISKSAGGGMNALQLQNQVADLERDIALRKLLWESNAEWEKSYDEWINTPFHQLEIDEVQESVSRFLQTIYMLEKGLPKNEIVPVLKENVLEFKLGLPLISSMRNDKLLNEHWEEIQYTIGRSILKDEKLTLGHLLKWKLVQHRDFIIDISTRATNEATLVNMLSRLSSLWQKTDFKLVSHQTGTTYVMIISQPDEMYNQLEESQVTMGTIKGSRYLSAIKNQVEDWDRKLMLFSRALDEWIYCQRNWLLLEPVFTNSDIQRQLPIESELFNEVDLTWKGLMKKTEDKPNALKAATGPGVLETLQSCNSDLEKVQKSLEDYLELKRLAFPRFYFLSNDELLSILSSGQDANCVQPHLAKCFANIKFLKIANISKYYKNSSPYILSMVSAEREEISLNKNIKLRGSVEVWLSVVENSMSDTMKKKLFSALKEWNGECEILKSWMFTHPGQVVLVVIQIWFNENVTSALFSDNCNEELKKLHETLEEFLTDLSDSVSEKKLPPHQYFKLESLIITLVHIRDITESLIKNNINDPEDFQWKRQLLYKFQMPLSCRVVQCNFTCSYGFEYLGCSSRLVITPLTDRCFLTITGALQFNLGGSPAGPAGTGKSETVKDLAKSMGKQCVVFNCSEDIDYKTMGHFFSGLCQSGSWCCFDEFNRIDIEVLSVIASQVRAIKSAKDATVIKFMFEGKEIKLMQSCGYFITMNPGYMGRVELPDNLKSLFRPVAMMIPDSGIITEVILFSEGFRQAKLFSRKIVNLYKLTSSQLSQQDHYDFGMRSIKSVLIMAGHKKRQLAEKHSPNITEQEILDEEQSILIHALTNSNLPRLLSEDAPLFNDIMSDLFPGVDPPNIQSPILETCIKNVIKRLNLEEWRPQIRKIIQLHEQLEVRHGVMLVGPSGGGKTIVRRVLRSALCDMNSMIEDNVLEFKLDNRMQYVETFTINPKCVSLGELYGSLDENTLEWTDGLLSNVVRRYAKELSNNEYNQNTADKPFETESSLKLMTPLKDDEKETKSNKVSYKKWVILDGPVDTTWVENLNTALDDTKTLCLSNGERIGLPENLRLIFEVDSLAQASPATISRCAMVYMEPVDLGWKPFVKSWIRKLPSALPLKGRVYLWKLFCLSIDSGKEFIEKKTKLLQLPVTFLSVVQTLCRLLEAFFKFMDFNGGFGEDTEQRYYDQNFDYEDLQHHNLRMDPSNDFQTNQKPTSKRSKQDKDQDENKEVKWFLESNPERLNSLIGKLFVFSFTWSVGGVLNREDDQQDDSLINTTVIGRDEELINVSYDFDHFIHDLFENHQSLSVSFPSGSKSIFSYFVDLQSGRFTRWTELVPATKTLIEKGLSLTQVGASRALMFDSSKATSADISATLVPTTDTIRYSFLLSLLLLDKQPVLLAGDSGVGKLMLMQSILHKLSQPGGSGYENGTILGDIFYFSHKNSVILQDIADLGIIKAPNNALHSMETNHRSNTNITRPTEDVVVNTIQFSALTKPSVCQNQVLSKLMKRNSSNFSPYRNKHCITFINDVNIPSTDQYGTQTPLELLRQFMDLNGFYNLATLNWLNVSNVTMAAVAAPPSGNKSRVSQRFLSNFSTFVLPQPSTASLQHIYQVQLGSFLNSREFLPEVKDCLAEVVNCAIAIYYKMCNAMLPSPEKSHYNFNLRDLSAVIKGLMQVNEEVAVSRETMIQLFAHEASCIFHDRLVDSRDQTTFYQFLSDDLHNYFKVSIPTEKLMNEKVNFGDFVDSTSPGSSRVYKQLPPYRQLATILEQFYMKLSYKKLDAPPLVFFQAAIDHVIRAARVFRQQGGSHLLLVGIDGTGKATSCKLAAHLANCVVSRLNVVRDYDLNDFREEMKNVLKRCGVDNQPTVFLLTDADFVCESFLEDVNCILNTGENIDLLDNEDLDSIVLDIKHSALEANVPDQRSSIINFFKYRVSNNLHFAIAMSPAGENFRKRCRTHPALINCCTIDWYNIWPNEALLSVAKVYFSRGNVFSAQNHENDEEDDDVIGQRSEQLHEKDAIAKVCVEIHRFAKLCETKMWQETKRRHYTTPATYLEFIQIFTKILSKNRADRLENLTRLRLGMRKLTEANQMIIEMQAELVSLGPMIERHSLMANTLMKELSKETASMNEVRLIVRKEELLMKTETELVGDYAKAASDDLRSVLPALHEAVRSLDSLDKSAIAEIRVYTNPPELVLIVMTAVCLLLQIPTDWNSAKMALSDPSFLKRLVQLDRDTIPNEVFSKLRKITKEERFNPEQVAQVSHACMSMCKWVLALQHYHNIQKMILPKQKKMKEAMEALTVSKKNLKKKQESLNQIEIHLKQLEFDYNKSVSEHNELKERKLQTARRLERATQLIHALRDEEGRWKNSIFNLESKNSGIFGDALCSAGSVAYLGPFPTSYRQSLTQSIIKTCRSTGVPVSSTYNMIKSNTDNNQVRSWNNQSLPRDQHSIENAVIMSMSRRWPLLIDPQEQATTWIKEMENEKLRIIAATDAGYMQAVERAVRVGETLLLCDINEEFDAELRPVLDRDIIHRTGQDYIMLGGKEINYNNNFRLYLTTSKPNPHFLPDICIKVTIINFTITFEGLQGQLLSSVITMEKPQLEEQRSELLLSIAQDTEILEELENRSLLLLQEQEGHLLDDEKLIDVLRKSKATSLEVTQRLKLSEKNELKTDIARRKYLPIATRGAVLYFVIVDLEILNPMYKFSLQWFADMFIKFIARVNTRSSDIGYSVDLYSFGGSVADRDSMTMSESASREKLIVKPETEKDSLDIMSQLGTDSTKELHPKTLSDSDSLKLTNSSSGEADRMLMKDSNLTETEKSESNKSSLRSEDLTVPSSLFLENSDVVQEDSSHDQIVLEGQNDILLADILENMIMSLTRGIYKIVSYCLFANHQIVFSFLLVTSIMKNSCKTEVRDFNNLEYLPEQHWNIFLHLRTLGSMTDLDEVTLQRKHDWKETSERLGLMVWKQCNYLSMKLNKFQHLCTSLVNEYDEKWSEVFEHHNIYQLFSRSHRNITSNRRQLFDWSKLSTFERLILIKVLRPESLPQAIQQFITEELGADYINSGSGFDISEIYLQSHSTVPLIFILSPGSDPSSQLLKYANETRGSNLHVDIVSLGRGQGPKAESLIRKAQILKGRWVFLQNCHLASSFMPRLQTIVKELSLESSKVDADFRLWLSSKPDRLFPASILQQGLKLSVERARGVKSHLQQAFGSTSHGVDGMISGELFDHSFNELVAWKPLLFAICCFNAMINERQKFSTLGFNLIYDFTSSDLQVAVMTLKEMITTPVPLSALRYLIGEVIYGGRVTDEWDRRCLLSTINKLVNLDPEISGHLKPPSSDLTHMQMCDFINSLHPVDPPELFGMSKNAERAYLERESELLVDMVIAMQPRTTQLELLDDSSDEQLVIEIAQDILNRLPPSVEEDVIMTSEDREEMFTIDKVLRNQLIKTPDEHKFVLLTVARQEIDRFNRLLIVIRDDLQSLIRSLHGDILMTETLESTFNALLIQKVPNTWRSASYASCKLLASWVEDLMQRVLFFKQWAHLVVSAVKSKMSKSVNDSNKESVTLFPTSYWLSAFFFPQGFLTAILQNFARKYHLPVDTLTFKYKIKSELTKFSEINQQAFRSSVDGKDGVLIFGLYLDSAKLDENDFYLEDSDMKQRFYKMPEIEFVPVKVNEKSSSIGHFYVCPLYRTSTRAGALSSTGHSTNYVTSIQLPSRVEQDHWTLCGTALLCQLDD